MIGRSVPVRVVKTRKVIRIWSRVISCNYLFSCLFLFTVASGCSCTYSYISCDHLIYFTSMITHISSWDITSVYFNIIVDYLYLLFNYYHVLIVFMLVKLRFMTCSLRWYLYLTSSIWDWNVFDRLLTWYLELFSSWFFVILLDLIGIKLTQGWNCWHSKKIGLPHSSPTGLNDV